jgi:hypothetical protein
MTRTEATTLLGSRKNITSSVILLVVALIPWPESWEKIVDVVDSARSAETNRQDHDGHATGYYESLIGHDDGPEGPLGDLSFRLINRPSGMGRFQAADVVRFLDRDFLQFELKSDVHRSLFGQPFVTNAYGMHDDPITLEKPAGTFRIAVLGASMDMGWGVRYQDTYINKLQDWLNSQSAGDQPLQSTAPRRFEVMNFAVAAYSPLQRLETLRRKVLPFNPDLVIYSATTLDIRLMEIHICELLRKQVPLDYDFLAKAVEKAAIKRHDLRTDAEARKRLKKKLQPYYWTLYDQTLGAIAAECRSADVPVVLLVIPRVGKEDSPALRAEPVARLKAMAAHNGIPLFDLSKTFDSFNPAELEIAASDNHPNALGHRQLFLALARAVGGEENLEGRILPPGMAVVLPADDRKGSVDARAPQPDPGSGKARVATRPVESNIH